MTEIIKGGNLFMVTDEAGDIISPEMGLFYKDARHLSKYEIYLNESKLVMLSVLDRKSYIREVAMTNSRFDDIESGTIFVVRKTLIYDNVCYDRVSLENYSVKFLKFTLKVAMEADFKDMFKVRGFAGGKEGESLGYEPIDDGIIFKYMGIDNIMRESIVKFDKAFQFDGESACFDFALGPKEKVELTINVWPGPVNRDVLDFEDALERGAERNRNWRQACTKVETDCLEFNRLYERSIEDLGMLLIDVDGNKTVSAGIPWYTNLFGRDSIITSLFMIMANPEVAKGTLSILSRHQGSRIDKWSDEEPGKILHEYREGELANANVVPFAPYYGSIDSTPLFIILLNEYYAWTGDREFLEEMKKPLISALDWIISYGDKDDDGFIEYMRENAGGLNNQGWKDSGTSIVFNDGTLAMSPIALVEVQGYAYLALNAGAGILKTLGDFEKAAEMENRAEDIKDRFDRYFWMEDKGYYAEALDGNKDRVDSVTSNPGHILFSGIVDEGKAKAVADRLFKEDMFSGWGIRTMSTMEAAYNPLSYHNGSVWPHDNGLIALGLARYGLHEHVKVLFKAILDAACEFNDMRLPELFCGFSRNDSGIVRYPVACSPQAWAAATPIALLKSILGLEVDLEKGEIILKPSLPEAINQIEVKEMRVWDKCVSFKVRRDGEGTSLDIIEDAGIKINMI
ncbi:MAG: amylo-alpha-1,6-glucosidase [Thermoanaerobacteraceae bacterium]|nr:amylo-alpha-1,6-glucosidase [Thermoanaerobacteraceae bacterium]